MTAKKKKKNGRPSKYTPTLGAKICGELAKGKPLAKICKYAWSPNASTVYLWRREHEDFSNMYDNARADQADYLADETVQIADNAGYDVKVDPETGNYYVDGQTVARARLQCDTRKWFAAKMLPKQYGDKVQHTGADGGDIKHNFVVEFIRPDDDKPKEIEDK